MILNRTGRADVAKSSKWVPQKVKKTDLLASTRKVYDGVESSHIYYERSYQCGQDEVLSLKFRVVFGVEF
jgi:hypothetical protein